MTGLAVAMLCIPMMVLRRLKNIYVDGLMNGVDVRGFTDDFIAQAKSQTTVVSPTLWAQTRILTSSLTGKRHHGSKCQHPCYPRLRLATHNKDAVLHFLSSERILHYRMYHGATLCPKIEIPGLRGSIVLYFFNPSPTSLIR
jgi:hypothetical protein